MYTFLVLLIHRDLISFTEKEQTIYERENNLERANNLFIRFYFSEKTNAMNASGSKKSSCRSKESKRRRRREKRIRDKSASRSSRAEGTAKDNIESTRNLELRQRLKEEIRKRQRLQSENLDLCMKLEKRRKIDSRVCNGATYTGQLYKVIKSTKETFTKEFKAI